MKKQTVLQGSLWLIASAAAAKLLGAVFRLPLTAILGGTGMGYFSSAYGLFLPVFTLSVTGINTVVAALTARALAAGDGPAACAVTKAAGRLFGWLGLGLSVLLFVLAEPLCTHLLHNPGAAPAVQCFAPAVWLCCRSAVFRGSFEGRCQMTPTAVSQTVEGMARVLFGLSLTALALRYSGRLLPHLPAGMTALELAAAAAIFGVTLSTAAGLLCVRLFPLPRCGDCRPAPGVCGALLRLLLPIAAASLVTNLTTLIDLAAGLRVLSRSILADPAAYGLAEVTAAEAQSMANFQYGAFSGLAMTVFNLVPAITNMLGKGVFPAFAESWAQRDLSRAAEHARTVLLRTAFLAVPAGLGITVLAAPILTLLFPTRPAETAAAAPALTLLGLAVICAAMCYPLFSMLQAAGFAGDPVKIMLPGAAVKLAGNLLLIPRMQLRGAALSTLLCYGGMLLLAMRVFRRRLGRPLPLWEGFTGTLLAGLLCALTAGRAFALLRLRLSHTPAVLAAVALGAAVYLLCQLLLARAGGTACSAKDPI